MNSIPLVFCNHVMANLNAGDSKYGIMSVFLTGTWKIAAQSYWRQIQEIHVRVFHVDGAWGYCIITDYIEKPFYARVLDDLLRMDRRFLRCTSISVGLVRSPRYKSIQCSKEELFGRVIPFFIQQSTPNTYLDITYIEYHPLGDVQEFLDYFQSYNGFRLRRLELSYFGQESDDFLAAWLKRDCSLLKLKLDESWPESKRVEL
uniref:FTH domain-containing protein n=1 Tax=Steinernema glaseri TaxID=37863 RepID=A0A1I7YDG7_9BILA